MNKKKVILITLAAAMAIALIAAWLIVRRKRSETEVTEQSGSAGTSSGSTAWTVKNLDDDYSYPIKRGDSGTVVTFIQSGLNDTWGAGLTVDGKFGPKTEAALLKHFGKKELNEADFAIFVVKVAKK